MYTERKVAETKYGQNMREETIRVDKLNIVE